MQNFLKSRQSIGEFLFYSVTICMSCYQVVMICGVLTSELDKRSRPVVDMFGSIFHGVKAFLNFRLSKGTPVFKLTTLYLLGLCLQ